MQSMYMHWLREIKCRNKVAVQNKWWGMLISSVNRQPYMYRLSPAVTVTIAAGVVLQGISCLLCPNDFLSLCAQLFNQNKEIKIQHIYSLISNSPSKKKVFWLKNRFTLAPPPAHSHFTLHPLVQEAGTQRGAWGLRVTILPVRTCQKLPVRSPASPALRQRGTAGGTE